MENMINSISFKLEDYEKLVYQNQFVKEKDVYDDFETKFMDYENRLSNLKNDIFYVSTMPLSSPE